jgi:hypothetical protein
LSIALLLYCRFGDRPYLWAITNCFVRLVALPSEENFDRVSRFSPRIYAAELIRLRAVREDINLVEPLIIRLTPISVPMAHSELPGQG